MLTQLFRFDGYELDFAEGQLHKNGIPIKLENIPLRLLLMLAEKNGQLVSREEIIEKLWGKNAFLDAEQGINTAIRKIRLALKDNPSKPRYIQTVVGRGYRFAATPLQEEEPQQFHNPPTDNQSYGLVKSDIQIKQLEPVVNGVISPSNKKYRIIAFAYRNFGWVSAAVLLVAAMLLATVAWAVHAVYKDSQRSALAVHQVAEFSRSLSASHQPDFGLLTAAFPIQRALGKHIRYTGYIKTKDITRGWAGLWWRVDGESGVLTLDNMQDRGVAGTTDWKQCEIDVTVPANAKNLLFGALLTGDGDAWFDDLAIEVDGVPYSDKSQFDLSFDSPTTKSFSLGGIGYKVKLDNQLFRNGGQSLSMKYVLSETELAATQ